MEDKLLAEGIVNKAIQEVVFKYNAYAPIISSFRIVYTDLLPTMGVDKYARLMINPRFVMENEAYIKGVIIHETLHVFFGHTSDTRSKLAYTEDAEHNKIANIAEDCAINQFISENLPESAITPSTLSKILNGVYVDYNKSAEEYYDLIVENMKKEKENKGNGKGEGGEGKGETQLGNGMCSTDQANTKAVQDALDKMGIEHMSQEEINDKALQTAQEICKSQGRQYGGLAQFAKEMLDPKVDWRPLLNATIRNAEKKVWTIHAKQTFKRVSRRSGQILIPKRNGQKISVALSFDTSGSISQDMVNQFLSEIRNCMKYSEIKECALWHTSNYWYGTPEELENKIEKVFEWGGTDSKCVEECAKHCKADLGFTFTDGYWGDDPQKPDNCQISSMCAIIWDGNEITEIRKLW